MKKGAFFTLFLTTNILFLILQIQKQSAWVKQSYEQQRLEQQAMHLQQRNSELTQKLHTLKNPQAIKEYAHAQGMRPIKLSQIKSISIGEHDIIQ
jgi:cell division protein FtsL